MPPMQIVFLFDLNAYSSDGVNIDADFNRKLLCLRLACLRILTHYCSIDSNLKWGFKFFDSRGILTQTMSTFSFSGVTLESFETLENEITVRYQRHVSYLEALSASVSRDDLSPTTNINNPSSTSEKFYPVQVLQHALTQILCEFPWNNEQTLMFSPSKKTRTNYMEKNDILFLVTKCPRKEQGFLEYFGADVTNLTPAKFPKLLLTHSLHEQLLFKSSILWIWLDTNCGNILSDQIEVLSKLADNLKSLKCSLVPVSILSNTPSALKYEGKTSQATRMDLTSSLMPISDVIPQSFRYQFYSSRNTKQGGAVIYFQKKEIYVHLIKFEVRTNRMKLHWNKAEKELFEKASTLTWSKLHFLFVLPKAVPFQTYGSFLCFPAVYGDEKNMAQFQHINKNLLLKDFSLFVICESTCGVKLPGLFSALTDTSGIVSIISSHKLFQESSTSLSFLASTCTDDSNSSIFSETQGMKPFQIECLESWFKSTYCISAIQPLSQKPENRSSLKSFYKKFSKKFSKQQKLAPEKENIAPEEGPKEEKPSQVPEVFEVINLSYEDLISLLKAEYDLALNTSNSVLQCARKIVKTAYLFFQLKSENNSAEDALKAFLKEFFTLSHHKIVEKYEASQEIEKERQEFKLQILLALETEILAPHPERVELIKNITCYFFRLSFKLPNSELNQFFQEVIKENYEDTLHDIVFEIGEETGISLSDVSEDDSLYDTSEPPSSESMLGSNNSRMSALSVKSTSGSSSRAESRKVVSRNDIMNNSKSRQFLLTRSSPRQKKYKNLIPGRVNIPIRYSPRLSSQRRKERNLNYSINASKVCRNLFPKDQIPTTPRYSRSPYKRKRMQTPKAHHVLKTEFVAETPTSKQNLSALRRRKSFMDTDDYETSLMEIAESPKIDKSAKNSAQCDLLKKFNELDSSKFVQPKEPQPSCSYQSRHNNQYTPESKHRLSLKLFSSYLTSPTARLGLRKCSKRLFDPVSPKVEAESFKRLKVDCDSEDESLQNLPKLEDSNETPKKS